MNQKNRCVMNLQKTNIIKYLLIAFWLIASINCGVEKSIIETETPPVETESPLIETEKPPTETEELPVETEEPPSTPKGLMLGMYATVPSNDATFDWMNKVGLNYVHSYRHNTPEENTEIFNLASKYDLKVMFNLRAKSFIADSADLWLSATMKDVERFKGHPALGMWYMWDEPSDEMLPNVFKLRKEIGKVSEVPTSLVIHWRTGWTNTRGHSDIWMVDYYPIRGQDFPNAPLKDYTSFVSSAAQRNISGTPFIPVMQAYKGPTPTGGDASKLRYPNLTEMRFMAFSSLTYGVHGLFFYGYYHARFSTTEGKKFSEETFIPIIKEIKAFEAEVDSPWNLKQNFTLNKDENINLGYWARSTGDFMIMTNNSPDVRSLKINLTKENIFPTNKKLIPWGATSKTNSTLNKGILSVDNVQPWETFIWKLE